MRYPQLIVAIICHKSPKAILCVCIPISDTRGHLPSPPPMSSPPPLNLVIGPAFQLGLVSWVSPWALGDSQRPKPRRCCSVGVEICLSCFLPHTHQPHTHKASSGSLTKKASVGSLSPGWRRRLFSLSSASTLGMKPAEKTNLKQKDLKSPPYLPTKGKDLQTSTPSWAPVTQPSFQLFLQDLGMVRSGERGGRGMETTHRLVKWGH